MAAKSKVLKNLSYAYLLRDTASGASSTINGAGAAKGQKVVPVASTTAFAVGDAVRVGEGEETELIVVASIQAGTSLTAVDNLIFDHAVGQPVAEQTVYDLGDITDGGVTLNGQAQTSDVLSAMRRLTYAVLNGAAGLAAEFALPGFTIHNFAWACGIPLASVKGNGSAATPYSLLTDGSDFMSEANQSLVVGGVTMDGTAIRAELWGIDMDYTAVQAQLRRGQLGSIPVRAVAANGGLIATTANPYTPDATLRPTKGKVFDALTEVGLFSDNGAGTTLSSNAAAGATSISAVGNTNIAAGKVVKLGTGETAEFHEIDSVTGSGPYTVGLKTPLRAAWASGSAVKPQTLTPFGGIHDDGVQLQVGGAVEEMRIATRKSSIGLKPGNAAVTVSFGVVDFSLANFARALGIPASAIVGGRLHVGDAIGSDQVDGAYVKGVLGDGTTVYIGIYGCSQDVSNFAAQLAAQGAPSLPIRFKPASGLHLRQP